MTASVHQAAARGFQRGADDYQRARPGYPAGVGEMLCEEMALGPGRRALDVAAGTGKLTADLTAAGASVVAVEPVEAMRAQLRSALPDIPVASGTAEALPVRRETIDLVTVAQAFHWFDPELALAEVRRVLRPGGHLAMIWNVRDQSVDWVRRLGDLIEEVGGGRPYDHHRSRDWSRVVEADGAFSALRERWFPNPQDVDVAMVVARVASTSWVSALDDDERGIALDRVCELLAADPATSEEDRFSFPHDTVVAWCQKT